MLTLVTNAPVEVTSGSYGKYRLSGTLSETEASCRFPLHTQFPGGRTIETLKLWLSSDRAPLRLALLGLILGAPALGAGLFMDDYVHRAAFLGTGQIGEFRLTPLRMFSFTDGNPEVTRAAMETGFYPWWTSEEVLINFWRPLTAATHALDHFLWPNLPSLMHGQSLVWFALTIFLVAILYRRVGGAAWTAGLAGLLFVVDESHGMPALWIANRNAILALFFGIACLLCHAKWRETRAKHWVATGVVALLASVHCNEGGIATTGYLFAFALFLDKGTLKSKALSLAPYAVAIIAWRIYYQALGFGVSGSPMYNDPGYAPWRFAIAMFWRAPALLSAQIANVPSEPFEFLPSPLWQAHWGISLAVILMGLWALLPLLRTSPTTRFWALGMVISLVPVSATLPSGRLLVFASVGGAALVAEYIVWVRQRLLQRGILHRALCVVLVVLHLVVAPLGFLGTALLLNLGSRAFDGMSRTLVYPEGIENRTLYLVNPPNYFLTIFTNVRRSLEGLPVPDGTHTLSSNTPFGVEMKVTRVDEDTLHVDPEGGFPYLLFRDATKPFRPGDRVELKHFTVEILSVNAAGNAQDVNYHFPAPLESDRFYWLQMDGFNYKPYTLPSIGETHIFNAGKK